ncbi:YlcG family protein [Escherichia coli]|nr:YlcG family protein [Escherichia coli]MCZ7344969.1 YlcG family protein [Escherichia coli]MEC4189560.1 YlcG family protein [Escherichia coli]MEC4237216.1 YlcG family protein [Escherichia coli]
MKHSPGNPGRFRMRLRLYRFPSSVLTDYRILRNYAKTLTGAGV